MEMEKCNGPMDPLTRGTGSKTNNYMENTSIPMGVNI